MKKEIISETEKFAIRVLRGGNDVNPQETAILPTILRFLDTLPEHDKTGPADDDLFHK